MKSYTDLEQSKKLAEMLPLESADMIYMPIMDIDSMSNSGFFNIPECYPFNEFKDSNNKPLPCWGLSALLDIIPKRIKDFNVLRIDIGEKDFAIWYDEIGYGVNTEFPNITKASAVDACVEMIVKLKEKNLI